MTGKHDPLADSLLAFLENIESAVVNVFRDEPQLTDPDVDKVYQGLISIYQAEKGGKKPPKLAFNHLEQQLFEAVATLCNWRLGKVPLDDTSGKTLHLKPISLDDMIACLNHLRSSIAERTGKARGRQGYLTYINKALP